MVTTGLLLAVIGVILFLAKRFQKERMSKFTCTLGGIWALATGVLIAVPTIILLDLAIAGGLAIIFCGIYGVKGITERKRKNKENT